MPMVYSISWIIYALSAFVLLFSFILFYKDTYEFFSSFTAALLSAALVFVSLIMLNWLSRVFRK